MAEFNSIAEVEEQIKNDLLAQSNKKSIALLYAFIEYFNTDLLEYFKKLGVNFKLERGGRYFPESDRAMDIVKALLNKIKLLNIPISNNSEVVNITMTPDNKFNITINNIMLIFFIFFSVKII